MGGAKSKPLAAKPATRAVKSKTSSSSSTNRAMESMESIVVHDWKDSQRRTDSPRRVSDEKINSHDKLPARNDHGIAIHVPTDSSMTVDMPSHESVIIQGREGTTTSSSEVEIDRRDMSFSMGTSATFSSSETLEVMMEGEISVEVEERSTQRPWLLPVSAQAFGAIQTDQTFWEQYRNEFAPSPLMRQRMDGCNACSQHR